MTIDIAQVRALLDSLESEQTEDTTAQDAYSAAAEAATAAATASQAAADALATDQAETKAILDQLKAIFAE